MIDVNSRAESMPDNKVAIHLVPQLSEQAKNFGVVVDGVEFLKKTDLQPYLLERIDCHKPIEKDGLYLVEDVLQPFGQVQYIKSGSRFSTRVSRVYKLPAIVKDRSPN